MAQKDVNPYVDQMKLMDLLMEYAEDDTLRDLLDLVAKCRGDLIDERTGYVRRSRKRFCSYRAKVRTRFRKNLDVVTLLWGSALVSTLDRAYEGGRHVMLHLSHGRKPPARSVARNVSDLLRQSGLKARIRHHTPEATVLSVSF